MRNNLASRIVATTLASSLIITAPGLPLYRAFAQMDPMGRAVVASPQGGAGVVINTGVPGAGQNGLQGGSSYNGLNGQGISAKFGNKKFGVSPSPAPSGRPLPQGEENIAFAESEDYGSISPEQLQGAAAFPLAAPAANPAFMASHLRAAITGNIGNRAAENENQAKQGLIRGKIEQLKKYFQSNDVPKLTPQPQPLPNGERKADEGQPALSGSTALTAGGVEGVRAKESLPTADLPSEKDPRSVIFSPELRADKDYNAGLESVRTWTPGKAIEFKSPLFASREKIESKKEKFHTGIAHGIWEKTQDWSKISVFYRKLIQGQSIGDILQGLISAAPSTGPPANSKVDGEGTVVSPSPHPAGRPLPAGEVSKQGVLSAALARIKGAFSPSPEKSVWWFLGGLLVAQVGIETLGIAMPMMMRERFGGFSAMAQIAVFASLASMVGRLTGGAVADKFGLKTTYIGSTIIRLLSISAMIGFLLGPGAVPGAASWLIAHHGTLWAGNIINGLAQMVLPVLTSIDAWVVAKGFFALKPFVVLTGFYSFNGFMGGIAITAEMTLPQAMLGQQRAVLERFFALEQWLIETVGFTGPKIGGKLIEQHGFIPALLVYPASFVIAIGLFIFGIQLPKKAPEAAAPAAAPAETEQPAPPAVKPPGFFKRVGEGATIVFKHPVMRTAFLGYTAYMILNPLLYSIVGPAYGLVIAGGNAQAGSDVASWVTALYSLGGLFGGLIMWRESSMITDAREGSAGAAKGFMRYITGAIDFVIKKAYLSDWLGGAQHKDGKLTEDGEKDILKKSTLLWMMLGTAGLTSFGTMLLSTPIPAYGAMIVFGIAQVIANLKLRTIVMSEAPVADRTKVNGFLGAASTGLIALMLNMTGQLFDGFSGTTPFMLFNGALVGVGATYVWLTQTLKRHAEAPGTDPGVKMRALAIMLTVMYGALGSYAVYMIGHALWGIVGPHVLAGIGLMLQHLPMESPFPKF